MVVLPSIKYTLKHFYKIITKINPKNQILYFQEFPTQCHRLVICDLLCHKKSLQMAKNIMLAIMRPIHIQIQFVHKWIFMRLLLDKKIAYTCMFMSRKEDKVSKNLTLWLPKILCSLFIFLIYLNLTFLRFEIYLFMKQ